MLTDFKVKEISCGHYHSAVVDFENNIWVIGSSYVGQLGLRDLKLSDNWVQIPNIKGIKVAAGHSNNAPLSS